MPKIALQGGSYEARSLIADLQRCLNLYPEANPEGAESPFTYYPTPGLTLLAEGPEEAPWRGLYRASDQKLYGVIANKLYTISESWAFELIGTLNTRKNPVSMKDNGIELVIVDGPYGYVVEFEDYTTFTELANFQGADRVDYIDTFFVFNEPDSQRFFTSLSNTITFDPLYFASKTSNSDQLVVAVVVHREIWLLGQESTEVWTNVGAPDFPFQIVSGMFIQHGCAAKYSVGRHGADIFWLARDKNGHATVAMGTAGNLARRISTRAIEDDFTRYARLNDAVGFTYQLDGHVYYMLTFPTANKTWVYDRTEELWHEECWSDDDGVEHRHRAGAIVFAYDKIVVGDRVNGKLYHMNPEDYTHNTAPVKRLRSFPHLVNDGKRVSYTRFIANMEVGTITDRSANPLISLRWSDTRGADWEDAMIQSLGLTGEYYTSVLWNRLGMARDRVFELSWSGPMKTALNGAYVEIEQMET